MGFFRSNWGFADETGVFSFRTGIFTFVRESKIRKRWTRIEKFRGTHFSGFPFIVIVVLGLSERTRAFLFELRFFFHFNSAFFVRYGVKGKNKVNLYKRNFGKVSLVAFRSKWGFFDRTGVWLMQLGFFSSNCRFSVHSGIKSKEKVNMLQKV